MLSDLAALKAHIKAHPVSGTPDEMRQAFDRLSCAAKPPVIRRIGGVPCGIFGHGAPVVWLHGGGYVFGSSHSHANVAAAFAQISGCQVIVPDYRRAPEHPWPAPLDDVTAVCAAFDGMPPVIGDSAGGHLALNLALHTARNPPALALISPNTDRTGLSTTRHANSHSDLMNDADDDAALAAMTFTKLPDDHPQVSPVLADMQALPPVYLTAARTEVLFGDACLLNAGLCKADVPVSFDIIDELFHLWPLWPDATLQAHITLQAIARHITIALEPNNG